MYASYLNLPLDYAMLGGFVCQGLACFELPQLNARCNGAVMLQG